MNLHEFVRLHKEIGYTVKQWNGSYFLNNGMVAYSFPQLMEIPVDKKLVNLLKWRKLITVIKTGHSLKNTCEYILKTENYSLETIRKKTRTTIKKSLRTCEFKRPELNELIDEGLAINRDTLKVQNRKDKFLSTPEVWKKYITMFYQQPETKILAAYVNEKMIAYAIAYLMDGKHYFHLQHINRQFATYYPMSGLMFKLINEIIAETGKIEISDGIESFVPMPSLNKFKRYMGFERVPITRVYVLHPVLVILLKPIVFYVLSLKKKRKIRTPFLQKTVDLYYGHRMLSRIIEQ